MAAITLSNFKWPQLQYFLDDSLHLDTKIISRICSFQNCLYLKVPQNELVLVSWEWVTYNYVLFYDCVGIDFADLTVEENGFTYTYI